MIRFLSRFRRRRGELNARLADATARAQAAAGELHRSRARQEAAREHVTEPLRRAGERNQFAMMIRDSLAEGHGRRA